MEHAEVNAKELQEQFNAKVHKIHGSKQNARSTSSANATNHSAKAKNAESRSPRANVQGRGKCYRCGYTNHTADKCKYKEYVCNQCNKKGHLAKACRSKNHQSTKLIEVEEEEEESYIFYNSGRRAFHITMNVNGKEVKMELDTGSGVTIMPEKIFTEIFQDEIKLKRTSQILKTYSGSIIPLKGEAMVNVKGKDGQMAQLRLLVADIPHQSSVLGRDWLEKLKMEWTNVFTLTSSCNLDHIMVKHKSLFSPGLGEIKGAKAKIHVQENAQAKFFKPRPVPYAMKTEVEEELAKLEKGNIISKVTHSEWAAPLVVVPKENGKVRLCGDFKVTINPEMKVDQYPLPTVQDLFATLSNGKKFTKLDLTQAYHQLPMDEDSKQYVTINTHVGLFRYNRMPYGIASGPAIFQKKMEEILSGIKGVQVFIDDIRLTGSSDEEHLHRLDEVLQRLEENGVKLNKEKCQFMQEEIDYLGHKIDAEGLHPQEHKIKAMKEVSRPENVKELRSFLGGVQNYENFCPTYQQHYSH
ncbi:Pol polyprotein [Plakobranchus ocellatus]|uniref:Pol polyprotein n=1 Tax=Plakobranchus ocellatus TaxID=259542 RepID=A0AAV3ZYQ5_9GAST|nr:Pol polyprotein [Plakobranchus ocellatus]